MCWAQLSHVRLKGWRRTGKTHVCMLHVCLGIGCRRSKEVAIYGGCILPCFFLSRNFLSLGVLRGKEMDVFGAPMISPLFFSWPRIIWKPPFKSDNELAMRLKGNELIKRNVFSCYSSTFFSFHVFSGHNARAGIRIATDDVLWGELRSYQGRLVVASHLGRYLLSAIS